jgi:hypothetical protein
VAQHRIELGTCLPALLALVASRVRARDPFPRRVARGAGQTLVLSRLSMVAVLLLTGLPFVYRDDAHVVLPARIVGVLRPSWRARTLPLEVPAKGSDA